MNLLGKIGYKKTGYFAGLHGVLTKVDYEPFCNNPDLYIIKFSNGGGVMAHKDDIEIIEGGNNYEA